MVAVSGQRWFPPHQRMDFLQTLVCTMSLQEPTSPVLDLYSCMGGIEVGHGQGSKEWMGQGRRSPGV